MKQRIQQGTEEAMHSGERLRVSNGVDRHTDRGRWRLEAHQERLYGQYWDCIRKATGSLWEALDRGKRPREG